MSDRKLKSISTHDLNAYSCTACAWAVEMKKTDVVKAREAFRQHDCADYPNAVPIKPLAKAASASH